MFAAMSLWVIDTEKWRERVNGGILGCGQAGRSRPDPIQSNPLRSDQIKSDGWQLSAGIDPTFSVYFPITISETKQLT
jgi:hypothetical protein